ncbi:MAG: aldehyde ferredoxin oxidoreductase C-terminal domain-containing protein [Candidatus Caldarchaeum sp.]|nr:aldehyde ferredoxin oxidoreductase C-terminal domain-containing protein [Candidatus Caldarchaeum sp.]
MKIVRLDLTEKSAENFEFDDFEQGLLGGRMLGLGLIARNSSVRDPLDPESPLVVCVGSLAGTGFPLGNRLTMVFRSPQTGTVAWAQTGGYAAYELASLGINALYITGRCEKLSTIVISEKGISFVDAEAFRGFGAVETCAVMRIAAGDARILTIGPAGERSYPIATVINDMGRSSGVRHGAGAVFGSKNIKAIVIKTSKRGGARPRNPLVFAQLLRKLKTKTEQSPLLNIEKGLLAVYGTAIAAEALAQNDAIPVKNYTFTTLENYERIGGKTLANTVLVSRLTCSMCPVSCRRETIGYGVRGEGPDYAQISSLGTNCYVLDHEKISYLNSLCYDAGVDPIEMGNTLAVYADMSEKGYTEKPLRWGDFKTMSELVEKTARGEDLGQVFAHGAAYTAKFFGDEYFAPSVKNISIQNTDPRAEQAWGLINAVESFGGGVHVWVYPTIVKSFENLGVKTIYYTSQSINEIAETVYQKQVQVAMLDSLGVCAFSNLVFEVQDYVDGVSAFYGVKIDKETILGAGMNCMSIERYLNGLYGFGAGDDRLPKKFTETPLPSGKHSGNTCPIEELLKYYRKVADINTASKIISNFPKLS